MSKAQRDVVTAAHDKAKEALQELIDGLDEFKTQLEEKFDSRSEKWQESDKGEAARERIDEIESLYDSAQCSLDQIEDLDLAWLEDSQ